MSEQDIPQKTALFNPFNGHLEQLFGYIDIGDLGLPDIQRPFVWRDSKVRDLLDSLYKGFPIGSYLLWRNTAGGRSHQIGIKDKEHKDPNLLIIDGQQRLTALYSVFRGIPVKDEDYDDRTIVIAFNPVTEEFKVADASTGRNPEFIHNVTDLFTKASTRTFINAYLEKIKSEADSIKKKLEVIITKIENKDDLTQFEVDLLVDKLKAHHHRHAEGQTIIDKFGIIDYKSQESDAEVSENENNDTEADLGESINDILILLSNSEIEIIKSIILCEEDIDEDVLSSRIEKLYNLKNYPFNALEIVPDLTEEQVAEIFTRINSKGTVLKQADFILTLLSVFWRQGREQIDAFCKSAKKIPEKETKESAFNYIFEPKPKDLIRVVVGLGFNRGKMKDAYAILTGRDFVTQKTSTMLREEQFEKFKAAQQIVLDNTHWHGFLKIICGLGFKGKDLISSANNIANAYILYLIAKTKFNLDHREIEKYIGRWFFFSSVTSRYSFSPESQMDSDLNYFKEASSKAHFVELLDTIIKNECTSDFWEITVPNKLLVSSSKHNAIRNAFFACLIRRNTNVLFSDKKIGDLFEPSMKLRKNHLEKHHIFPRNYLIEKFGLGKRQVNQVANFTYLEFEDNIEISDDSPRKYFLEIKKKYYKNREDDLEKMLNDHCLPGGFYEMNYDTFLAERRKLMAKRVQDVFESL